MNMRNILLVAFVLTFCIPNLEAQKALKTPMVFKNSKILDFARERTEKILNAYLFDTKAESLVFNNRRSISKSVFYVPNSLILLEAEKKKLAGDTIISFKGLIRVKVVETEGREKYYVTKLGFALFKKLDGYLVGSFTVQHIGVKNSQMFLTDLDARGGR